MTLIDNLINLDSTNLNLRHQFKTYYKNILSKLIYIIKELVHTVILNLDANEIYKIIKTQIDGPNWDSVTSRFQTIKIKARSSFEKEIRLSK